MSSREAGVIEARPTETPGAPRARMMLQRGRWAATAFAEYDRDQTRKIVSAVAEAAFQNAQRFAEQAVAETGMGVADHKRRKNEACSRGLVERYAGDDYVSLKVDAERKLLEVPKPAGVVLALTPSTNPIATVYFKVLLALMTRNAIVVSPHPMARKVSVEAVAVMARSAVAAGAPDGCIQIVQEPTIPLIEALMADPGTDVIVATGGNAVVRAAYRSGNPSLGVGPGNVPAFVDSTADIEHAAWCLAESKSFDNSILCTNESTLVVRGVGGGCDGLGARTQRRSRPRPRGERSHTRRLLSGGSSGHGPGRKRCSHPRAGRRNQSSVRHAGAGGAVLARRSGGAARSREAVPPAGDGPGTGCPPWSRRGPGVAANRGRRPLGGDPFAGSANDPRLRGGRARPARDRQRAGEHRSLRTGHPAPHNHDRRDRLLRWLIADREPSAQALGAVDPGGLCLRSQRAVR